MSGQGVAGWNSDYQALVSGQRWKVIWDQYLVVGASNIKTLLKFDNGTGAVSDVEFLDESGRAWTSSDPGGPIPTVSTTYAKYGASSMRSPNQYYITAEYSTDFYFADEEFCIETWIYHVDSAKCHVCEWGDTTYGYRLKTRPCDTEGIRFEVYWNNGADSFTLTYDDSIAQVLTVGSWHHVAIVRDGSVFKLYLDGNSVASDTAVTIPDAISCVDPTKWKFRVTGMEVF